MLHQYELRYTCESSRTPKSYSFRASCLGGALDKARVNLRVEKGCLYRDGRPVCSLELGAGAGVWLVGAPELVDQDLSLQASAVE